MYERMKTLPNVRTFTELEVEDVTLHARRTNDKGEKVDGDFVYYCRQIPTCGICNIQELKIRSLYEDALVGVDSFTSYAYYISLKDYGKKLFKTRLEADEAMQEYLVTHKVAKVTKSEDDD